MVNTTVAMAIDTFEIEKKGPLDIKLLNMLEQNVKENPSAQNYVHIIFFCWHLLVEEHWIEQEILIPEDLLQEKMVYYFKQSYEKFEYNDPVYLFFVGWTLNVETWRYGVLNDYVGKYIGECFHWRAYHLNPTNKLYKYIVSDLMKLPKEEEEELKRNVDSSQFEGMGYFLKEYFEGIFKPENK